MNKFSDKYEVIRPLGQGGMCDVFLAQQLLFDRTVAIKTLKDSIARSEDCCLRFIREAKNCASLSHESIITIYEVGEFEGKPFLSMQYMDKGSYDSWLVKGGPLNDGLKILLSVAEALQCAHSKNILHRDLKPDNVLLNSQSQAKVGDWGLAKLMSEAQEITQAGVVLGTPEYMSPEQILSKPLSNASDLYSFGIMLYETLTGCLPFPCATMTDILQAHLYKEPYPIRKLAPHISDDLENLVTFLLMKDSVERLPSAEFLVFELKRIMKADFYKYKDIIAKRKNEEDQTPSAIEKLISLQTNKNTTTDEKSSKRTTHKIVRIKTSVPKGRPKGRITVGIKSRKNKLILIVFLIIVCTLLFIFRLQIYKLYSQ